MSTAIKNIIYFLLIVIVLLITFHYIGPKPQVRHHFIKNTELIADAREGKIKYFFIQKNGIVSGVMSDHKGFRSLITNQEYKKLLGELSNRGLTNISYNLPTQPPRMANIMAIILLALLIIPWLILFYIWMNAGKKNKI